MTMKQLPPKDEKASRWYGIGGRAHAHNELAPRGQPIKTKPQTLPTLSRIRSFFAGKKAPLAEEQFHLGMESGFGSAPKKTQLF